ncbi:MAG: hypothetical protein R3Y53_11185 [Bacillota bacterium]
MMSILFPFVFESVEKDKDRDKDEDEDLGALPQTPPAFKKAGSKL